VANPGYTTTNMLDGAVVGGLTETVNDCVQGILSRCQSKSCGGALGHEVTEIVLFGNLKQWVPQYYLFYLSVFVWKQIDNARHKKS